MLDRIHRLRRGALTAVAVLGTAAALAGCDKAKNNQDSLSPKGPYSREIQNLFIPFFWVAVVIGVGVTAATIFAAVHFRVRPGEDRQPKQVHGNSTLEIVWTAIPALILAVMAVPTVATIWRLAERPEGPEVVHIKVIGKQWWWEYEYTDDDFVTANEMHIPVGRPVSLDVYSPVDGVIHSFWVPNLNGKKDVVPGRDQFLKLEADRPGEFWGQCAEYCGLSHANMRIRVFAQTESDYNAWVAQQKKPASADLATFVTDTLATKWGCTTCHAFNGVKDASARIGPNLTHLARPHRVRGRDVRDELPKPVEMDLGRARAQADGHARRIHAVVQEHQRHDGARGERHRQAAAVHDHAGSLAVPRVRGAVMTATNPRTSQAGSSRS